LHHKLKNKQMSRLSFIILGLGLLFTSCKNNGASVAANETISTTEVTWLTLTDAESKAKKQKKNVFVDVYTPWCGPCKMLDKRTFIDPDVINLLNENFYSVKFNAEGPDPIQFQGKEYKNPKFNPAKTRGRNAQHELAPFFAVRGYPTMVVMDENMKIVEKITGFKTAEQLKEILAKYAA